MKFFERITAIFMAVLMTLCSFGTSAMAAENSNVMVEAQYDEVKLVDVEYDENGNKTEIYEFDVSQNATKNGYAIVPMASLDQTFSMTGSHRGGDRSYSGNRLQYTIQITDSNGNAVDNTVSVQLHDYNHNYALTNTHVTANGSTTTVSDVAITPGRIYYFYYQVTSGASRALKVRMIITDYTK